MGGPVRPAGGLACFAGAVTTSSAGWASNDKPVLTVLEAGKSEVKVWADSVSGGSPSQHFLRVEVASRRCVSFRFD